MKHAVIRHGLIVLLLGLVALAAGRGHAQTGSDLVLSDVVSFEVRSASFGISPRQTARISLAHLAVSRPSSRTDEPVIARIQLLDTEGQVLAQSDEIRVAPGHTRFWDVLPEVLPAAIDFQPSRFRLMRARITIQTRTGFIAAHPVPSPPLAPAVELIDRDTGRTVGISAEWLAGRSR